MTVTIENLLRQNYVDGIFHTHVSMMEPKGKYNLSRESLIPYKVKHSAIKANESEKIFINYDRSYASIKNMFYKFYPDFDFTAIRDEL